MNKESFDVSKKKKKFTEIANNTIIHQIETRNGIQGASSKVLSFTAIFITIILAIIKNNNFNCHCSLIFPIGFGLFSMLLLIECIRSKPFHIGINEIEFKDLIDQSYDDILTYEMNTLMTAAEDNSHKLNEIRRKFTIGLYLMMASIISSIIILLNNL